jgi:outer membrane protein OmpA-like peptidoglycan-associated protein
MRSLPVFMAIALGLSGCGGTNVSLYDGEEACFDTATQKNVQCPTGGVAVLNDETGEDLTLLEQANSRSKIKGANTSVKNVSPEKLRAKYGALLDGMPQPPRKIILYFKNDTELVDESRALIAILFDEIKSRPGADVEIIGHTDSLGERDDNDRLSKDRAEKVQTLLAAEGLDSRVVAVDTGGRGEREPINNVGMDEAFSPLNRRVEVFIK